MNKLVADINNLLLKAERKTGLLIFSLLVGISFTGLAMLYVSPQFHAEYNGAEYSRLSLDPFDFSWQSPFRFRILAPMLGYLTGLRGELFFIVPLIFAILFASAVYGIYRKKNFNTVDSVFIVASIVFSCVFLIQLQAPGYTDVIYYFFLFLSFAYVKRPALSAVFFCLGLFTHESLLFMLPGLVIYYRYLHPGGGSKFLKYIVMLIIASLPMFIFREWMGAQVEVAYDMKFYLSEENIRFTLNKVLPRIPLGLFFVFKLAWVLPLWLVMKSFYKRNYLLLFLIAVMLVCDLVQMVIAYDVTRMLCLVFPLLLVSIEELRNEHPEKFTLIMIGIVFVNFLVPQYFMSADGPVPMPCVFPFLQTF
ncbi:MAG TPA: hypothetical protein VF868_06775 [Bacteroidia bacterium]|jgi:hypothetical protein